MSKIKQAKEEFFNRKCEELQAKYVHDNIHKKVKEFTKTQTTTDFDRWEWYTNNRNRRKVKMWEIM